MWSTSNPSSPSTRRRSAAPRLVAVLVAGALLAILLAGAALAADFTVDKTVDLVADANGDGLAGPGDTLFYTVTISNSSLVTVEQVILSDTVPLNTAYVTATTDFDDGGGPVPIPDGTTGTPFPLDEGGKLLGDLPVNGIFSVTFQVVIDNPYLGETGRITNVAYVAALSDTVSAEAVTPVNLLALEKSVNDEDADEPPGPSSRPGDPITWTYVVSVTGQITVANVTVTDSVTGITPVYVSGDINVDSILDPGEQWLFQAVDTAIEGQYANLGVATGLTAEGDPVQASDPSHYFGEGVSEIDIEKVASVAFVTDTTPVTYTYTVSNPGTRPLSDVTVTDDKCAPVAYVSGDTGADGILTPGEVWAYTCTAEIEFATRNTAVATGLDPLDAIVQDSATAFVDSTGLYLPIVFNYAPPKSCLPPNGCLLEGRIKGMDVHQGTGALYVVARDVDGTKDQLLKVDPSTFEIVARVDTGAQPWGVVVNETTNRVYVSNFDSGDVRIYDAGTLAPLGAPIPVGDNPGRMAILEALDTVFVVVRGGSKIAVIQGLGLAELVDAGGSGPWGIAADPVRNYVYVSNSDSVSFSLLRQVNGAWVAQPGTGKLEDRNRLFGLAYNAANGKLYAPYADKEGDWFVDIWEPHAFSPWGRVTHTPVPSGGALNDPDVGGDGIVVNPATGNVFTANAGADSVSVIDGAGDGELATITVLDDPFHAAADGKLNTVYIGLRAPGRVVKIDDGY